MKRESTSKLIMIAGETPWTQERKVSRREDAKTRVRDFARKAARGCVSDDGAQRHGRVKGFRKPMEMRETWTFDLEPPAENSPPGNRLLTHSGAGRSCRRASSGNRRVAGRRRHRGRDWRARARTAAAGSGHFRL